MKYNFPFLILILLAVFSCTSTREKIYLENQKVNGYDSIEVKKLTSSIDKYANKKQNFETEVCMYKTGLKREILTYSSKGILIEKFYLDSLITVNDSLANRTYTASVGQTMLFSKKGRLMFHFKTVDLNIEGPCFCYSIRGQLNAIYIYKHNRVVNTLYTRNDKFNTIDSSFTPYSVWIENVNPQRR